MQQAFDQYLPELEKQWIWFRQHQKAFKELRDKRFAHVDASLINKEYKLFEVEPPTWNTMKQAVETSNPGGGDSFNNSASDPVRERTALNVGGKGLICLAHRVRTEVGNAPLHDGLVFFWSSCLAIVGCEFRKIRPGDDERYAAVRVERHLTLRIGTKQIALLAVLLKRDRNERPRSYEVFGRRLRGYLLGQKNSENQH